MTGITSDVRFDENGFRDLFYLEILELVRNNYSADVNYEKFVLYDLNNGGIKLLRNFENVDEQTTLSMQNKLFKVILRQGMPFLRRKYISYDFLFYFSFKMHNFIHIFFSFLEQQLVILL